MMPSPWRFFSLEELRCKCGQCGSTGREMDNQLMQQLVMLRENVGAITLSSAYRCPEYNNRISSTGYKGAHTTGKAADILVSGAKAVELLKEIIKLNFTGYGFNQKGGGRFIHLDTCGSVDGLPRPAMWSY